LPGVEIIHRGRIKRLTAKARRVLKRREAVAPVIGPLKDDCGLPRNWQKGSEGDVRHPVHCAASDNLRWLMRVFACLGLKAH
jgi:transposase, IS5 family